MNDLKKIQLFLLDMDGTINVENTLIDGAQSFIDWLVHTNTPYCFVTNNSSRTKLDYVNKMSKLGIACQEDQVFTSGMAMGIFLSQERPGKKVYLVGTKALEDELAGYKVTFDDNAPDIVVVGYDRSLTYEKIEKACHFLHHGSEFLATHMDVLYPIEHGAFLPDCGSICDMLTSATKKKPYYIGKPNPKMMDILAKKYRISPNNIAVVGDRLYTDIAWANNAFATSILVLSGETKAKDLMTSVIQPHYVYDSVKELVKDLSPFKQ